MACPSQFSPHLLPVARGCHGEIEQQLGLRLPLLTPRCKRPTILGASRSWLSLQLNKNNNRRTIRLLSAFLSIYSSDYSFFLHHIHSTSHQLASSYAKNSLLHNTGSPPPSPIHFAGRSPVSTSPTLYLSRTTIALPVISSACLACPHKPWISSFYSSFPFLSHLFVKIYKHNIIRNHGRSIRPQGLQGIQPRLRR